MGFIVYFFTNGLPSLSLVPCLLIGALASLPFTAKVVKKSSSDKLRLIMGVLILLLGVNTLLKVFGVY